MVHSIKNAYVEELGVRRMSEGEGDVSSLPVKKGGRQFLLGHQLDLKVQLYLKKVQSFLKDLSALLRDSIVVANMNKSMPFPFLLRLDVNATQRFALTASSGV